jgi:ABC-type sugar transport system substrate-binding protein
MRIASPGRTRPFRTRLAAQLAAACALALLLAACSNTTARNGGSSTTSAGADGSEVTASTVDKNALAATIKKAFLADIPVSDLDPVVADALAVASQPLTPEQTKLLQRCLQSNACDTGRGSLTVAFANDHTNPFLSLFRAEITAQAIAYPQVRKIIYNNANGNVGAVFANLRSLIAQKPDVLIMASVFGSTVQPAIQQAKQAGIVVVQAGTPLPEAVAADVDSQIAPDLCKLYTDGAKTMANAVGSKSTYALYTGIPGNDNAAVWQPCAQKSLNSLGWSQTTEGFTQWTPQGAAQAANALLASGKNPGALLYDYTPDDFVKPYIAERRTPPAVMTDVANYSFLTQVKEAKDANVAVKGFISNSHVWFGRMGVTAGMKTKFGQKVTKDIKPPMPVVPVDDTILSLNAPGTPANVPVPCLLTPEQMNMGLAVS